MNDFARTKDRILGGIIHSVSRGKQKQLRSDFEPWFVLIELCFRVFFGGRLLGAAYGR